MPPTIRQLNWRWETRDEYLKILGFHMGEDFSQEQMVKKLTNTLEDRVHFVKGKSTSLASRLMIINHIILVALWFLLTLWIGSVEELRELEKKIVHFLWA